MTAPRHRRTVAGMLFRRASRRREDDLLRSCPVCRSRLACPVDRNPSDDSHWHIDLRCGDCGFWWEMVIGDGRAARYDIELDQDRATIQHALRHLDLERMAFEVETFAVALSRDLNEPADFAR
jgi:hypothetical protein